MTGRRWIVALVLGVGSMALAACSSTTSSPTTSSSSAAPSGSTTTSAGTPSTTGAASTRPPTFRSPIRSGPSWWRRPAPSRTFRWPSSPVWPRVSPTTGWTRPRESSGPAPDWCRRRYAEGSDPSQAQISSQDAGSYYVFQQPSGGSWTAYPAGNTGPGTTCPVTVPSGRAPGMGLAGRQLPAQRGLTGVDRAPVSRRRPGRGGSGTASVLGNAVVHHVLGPLATGPEALLVADEGIPKPAGRHAA